jgi:hypothetical protein
MTGNKTHKNARKNRNRCYAKLNLRPRTTYDA